MYTILSGSKINQIKHNWICINSIAFMGKMRNIEKEFEKKMMRHNLTKKNICMIKPSLATI